MELQEKKKVRTAKIEVPIVTKPKWISSLWLLFYPAGVFNMWKSSRPVWLKLLYTIGGLPVFIFVFTVLAIMLFAAFLPALDRSPVHRSDRTIVNSGGDYSVTFIKTGAETNGAYELVEVELEPYGGNMWHYHSKFEESFTVLDGKMRIGYDGKELLLNTGDSVTVNRKHTHFFKNATGEKAKLLEKIAPAAGLEKTLRVSYGLANDGLMKDASTDNPWHLVLLLAYSESYLSGVPGWFQEPLINSLAKIAQWKGEDKALYKYFKS